MSTIERLAVYGTLRPGEENHWLVRGIAGQWTTGTIRGWTYPVEWGPGAGYPGLTLSADGNHIAVAVLTSDALHRHWRELDDYEGPGYRRVETTVIDPDGESVTAWVYETVTDAE